MLRILILTLMSCAVLNAFTSEPFWEASNGFKAEKLYFESVNHPGGDNDFRPEVIIILPPEYFQNIDMRFPVIYRLHGQLSFPKEDCGEGGPWHTDLAYLSNKLNRPFILVAPDGDMNDRGNSFYRGSDGYSFEKYFSEELIDSIDANFRTIPRRTARVVSGYSMGGYGSIHLAQTFPDLLGVSLTYAALTMNMHYVRARNFFSVPLLMNEFQGAMLYSSNVKFDTVLTNRSVPHHSFFPEGGISGGHTSCIPGCGTPREQSLVFIDTMLDKIRNTPFSWQHTRLKPYDHPSNTPDTIFIFGNRFIVSQSRYEKKSDTEANLEHFASLRIYSFEKERIHTGLLERKDLNDYDMKWDDSLSYETVDILTAPYYSAGSEFTIVDSNITSGISKSYNITADEEKRLEFSLNGEEHIISISGEFVNPEVSPLSPGPLTLIKNCSKAVTFSWNTDIREASDGELPYEYRVYRNGTKIAALSPSRGIFMDNEVFLNTDYEYYIEAVDFDNLTAYSETLSVSVTESAPSEPEPYLAELYNDTTLNIYYVSSLLLNTSGLDTSHFRIDNGIEVLGVSVPEIGIMTLKTTPHAGSDEYSVTIDSLRSAFYSLQEPVTLTYSETGLIFSDEIENFTGVKSGTGSDDIICSPNPFNPEIIIQSDSEIKGKIDILDIHGRRVASPEYINGCYVWNAGKFPGGVYFVRFRSDKIYSVKKITLIK